MRSVVTVSVFVIILATCTHLASSQSTTTSALSRAVSFRPDRQPYIPREEQDAEAQALLAEYLAQNGNRRPNFVWLVVDDLGYGDIGGPWGGGGRTGAATPNIDALAAEGLSLMSTYSQPTCTPSRAAMMTGRLPYRSGLIRPILAGDKPTANPWTNESSIAKQLSEAGYYTVLTGKWHCGEAEGTRPVDVGFDEFQGYYTSQKEITQVFDDRRYPDLVLNEELLASFMKTSGDIDMYHGFKGQVGPEPVVNATTGVDVFAEADQMLANFSINKIKELAAQNKPFFLIHNFMRVHADNFPSKKYKGSSASKYPFKDNLVEVDAIVGEIKQALMDAGVLENTFIFFTSDNGPQMDSWPDSGFSPFRGGKSTTWEGGVRVPGIAYWKGMISPRISDDLFDQMDLYNTVLNLAGVDMDANLAQMPLELYVDGIDQTSFLLAHNGRSKREHVYMWATTHFMALRMREYKYHMKVVLQQNHKQIIDYSNLVEVALAPWLFNLYIDPREELPVGHRLNAWLATMGAEATLHAKTFALYPPRDVGLA